MKIPEWFSPKLWLIFLALLGVSLGQGQVGTAGFGNGVTDPDSAKSPMPAKSGAIGVSPTVLTAGGFGQIPLNFLENRGQVDRRVRFYSRGADRDVWFTREKIIISGHRGKANHTSEEKSVYQGQGQSGLGPRKKPHQTGVELIPLGLGKDVQLRPADEQAGKVNLFCGNAPQKWHRDLPVFGGVTYHDAYPGIDLKFYGSGGQLEYDLIIKPGADPSRVKFRYGGITDLQVTPAGDLTLILPDGERIVQRKPVIYQEIAGKLVSREGKFTVDRAGKVYGFEVAAYDQNYPLIVDPVLVFATYLGGSKNDQAYAVAVDTSGNVYVTGYADSPDFPIQGAYQAAFGGERDAFVTKFNPNGGLIYSTYLGGGNDDEAFGIALDSSGNAYVGGRTKSVDFPLRNAYQSEFQGSTFSFDAFVAKLNTAGNDLVYSTYLGGTANDQVNAVAVDSSDSAYVTGKTYSVNFPTRDPLYPNNSGAYDAFITKFTPAGNDVSYSTYLGGAGDDEGKGISLDSTARAHVTGYTISNNFPVANAYQGAIADPQYADAFVTKLNAAGSALAYSTYLGGSMADRAYAIAVDRLGYANLVGQTISSDFPTKFPYQQTIADLYSQDAFLTMFAPDGSLYYSSYLGGGNGDSGANGIGVDADLNLYVTGYTWSAEFPTYKDLFPTNKGNGDGFVTKFNANGSALLYSTFLGGTGHDAAAGIAVDLSRNAYVVGVTDSTDFPLKNAWQSTTSAPNYYDAFVTKIGEGIGLPWVILLLLD